LPAFRSSTVPQALPAEIGFLADHGVGVAVLREIATRAALQEVTADRVAIAEGHVSEADFYRALASELKLPFVARPALPRSTPFPQAVQSGFARLAEGPTAYVAAPSGERISLLFQHRQALAKLSITTPSALQGSLFRCRAPTIADIASYQLPDRMPAHSILGGSNWQQIITIALCALVISFVLGLDRITGGIWISVALSPVFIGVVVLRLAAVLLAGPAVPKYPRPFDEASLPPYTVIVALYREGRVLPRLIEALRQLDYPAAKLDIKLVLEQDDAETARALALIALPPFIEVIIAPPGQPRTKPRALNVALPLARGDLVVLYDAEDVPDPQQLRLAAASFAASPPDVGCLQARLTIDNTSDSLLTRLFTMEYAALFDVINPGMSALGCPIPLGGTSNHFRADVLREIGGWDAWNVTEDADLGIRLARFGYRTEDLASSTLEEAPLHLRAWFGQRTRWMKGFIQTLICHSRDPWRIYRDLGFWRFVGAFLVSAGTVFSSLGFPFFVLATIASWIYTPELPARSWPAAVHIYSMTLFIFGAVALFVPVLVALARRKLWSLMPWSLLLPFYYVLVTAAAWNAILELTRAPFHWNKTPHGLARSSRAGALPAKSASRSTRPAPSRPNR
jgi:cellulose synthase/poly-beta-1,6-N-acetylglucosamine synthase-like glycosyltransferase